MWFLKYIFILSFFQRELLCETTTNFAVELNKDNFDDLLQKKNHFVMFFAPWCGHSKKIFPLWEELAELLNMREDPLVIIAKVDCTEHQELCAQNEITGYPTLKFFKTDSDESVKFRGTRDLTTIKKFINEQLKDLKSPYIETLGEDGSEDPVQKLIELTEETFPKHVATGKHFVKFYAPWCGHCQRLAPTWDELSNSLEYNGAVTIAKIDCTQYRPICQDFDVKGYPTLLWIEDGKKIEKYTGGRSHEELKLYVEKMVGSSPHVSDNEVEDDKEDGESSSVAQLSGKNFEHGIEKGVTFVKFYAPWCGHCQNLVPVWDKLAVKMIGKSNVKIAKVDCTLSDNKDLCTDQQVEGYPTLFIYRNGEKIEEYQGSRQLNDLFEYVGKFLIHDEL